MSLVTHPTTGERFEDRRRLNGSQRIVWWILMTAVTVLTGIGFVAWGSVERKFEHYDAIVETRGARLAALEAILPEIQRRLAAIETSQAQMWDYWHLKLER